MIEVVKLGPFLKASTKKNKGLVCTDVYSVTNTAGFVPSTEYFSKEVFSSELSGYKLVSSGAIAYNPSRINVGSVAVQDKCETAIVSPLYVVFEVDKYTLLPEYVCRFLKSGPGQAQIAFRSSGTVRNNLKFDALCEMSIPLPDLAVQAAEVSVLNSVERQIVLLKLWQDKLDEIVKSRFVEMFGDPETNPKGWQTQAIGKLATDVRYGTSKPASADGEYTYIRMNNMTYEGGLDLSDTKRITLDEKELNKALVRYGDLLFNRTNSRDKVGKTCVFKLDEPMVIAGYIIRVRLCDDIEAEYLSTYLNTKHAKRMLKEMAHGAVNQANINAKEMQSIIVPVPPIELQREFLAFVQQVDKLKFDGPSACGIVGYRRRGCAWKALAGIAPSQGCFIAARRS